MNKKLNINKPFFAKWNVSYNLNKVKDKNNEYYGLSKSLMLIDFLQESGKGALNQIDFKYCFKNPFNTTIISQELYKENFKANLDSLFLKKNFNTITSKTSDEIIKEMDEKIFTGKTNFNNINDEILQEKIKFIKLQNLNKDLLFIKPYLNIEDFLNDYLNTVLNIPCIKIIVKNKKEEINLSEDLIEIEITHLKKYNYLNTDYLNKKNNNLKINLFRLLLCLLPINTEFNKKKSFEFLSEFKNKTYKNNNCHIFISNIFSPVKYYFPPILDLDFDFIEREMNLLNLKLEELEIGGNISEEIKSNFIEYKINENTFEYIYFSMREDILFLYIKSENNEIIDIETGYLNYDKFTKEDFDWHIEKVLDKKEELNLVTYEDFMKAKNELRGC